VKLPESPRTFISGGASGLGRALALELAARRARILIADVNLERANETATMVEHAGGSAHVMRCDVRHPDEIEACAREMETRWGGVDLAINNAGVAAAGRVGSLPLEDWRWIVDINMWGVIHGCHVFAPRAEFILNVASCAGLAALPEMAAYSLTKAAVISLSETLSVERGGRVSALCPTFFKTNLMENFRYTEERQKVLTEKFFARSTMTAGEVAHAGIRGLEAGELIIIPQIDGKLMWRFKRMAPDVYRRTVRIVDRLAGR
jgi:NAD(P)-dependent dehydrogenase (short-subunit alcohol dehydrogenase family)